MSLSQDIQNLIDGYDELNWFGRFFFPRSVGLAIESLKQDKALRNREAIFTLYQHFFKNTGFISRQLFSCLGKFGKTLVTETVEYAYEKGFLANKNAQTNFALLVSVIEKEPYSRATLTTLKKLPQLFWLSEYLQAIFETILKAAKPHEIPTAMNHFRTIKQADLDALCTAENPAAGSFALSRVQYFELLKEQTNRDAVLQAKQPHTVSRILTALNNKTPLLTGPLAQSNFDTVLNTVAQIDSSYYSSKLELIFETFIDYNLFNNSNLEWANNAQFYFKIAIEHYTKCDQISLILKALETYRIFSHTNIKAIIDAGIPSFLPAILKNMHESGLLHDKSAQPNFNALMDILKRYAGDTTVVANISHVIGILNKTGLLKLQSNYDGLLNSKQLPLLLSLLIKLDGVGLLNQPHGQANFAAALNAEMPQELADALRHLKSPLRNREKAQIIFSALTKTTNIYNLAQILNYLDDVGLLSNEQMVANVEALAKHSSILASDEVKRLLLSTPKNQFSQQHLEAIIELATDQEAVKTYISNLNTANASRAPEPSSSSFFQPADPKSVTSIEAPGATLS